MYRLTVAGWLTDWSPWARHSASNSARSWKLYCYNENGLKLWGQLCHEI